MLLPIPPLFVSLTGSFKSQVFAVASVLLESCTSAPGPGEISLWLSKHHQPSGKWRGRDMSSSLCRAGSLLPSVQVCPSHQTNPALASFCSPKSVCSFEARGYPIAARKRKGRDHEMV